MRDKSVKFSLIKMSKKRKVPKRLKGFNDFFAEDMIIREFVIKTFKETFERYGYEPLETPALEYSELLLGQSGEEAEKQFYRFEDNGGRDVMLRFEVMTAMCRAVAQNINNIPMPYKRYQIQRVWRAENVQKGRYREFTQCDADTIGSNSMICDAEFIQMGIEIVSKLGFKEYESRISNIKFLKGLAEFIGISDKNFYGFQMTLDKLKKIGKDGVRKEMLDKRDVSEEKVDEVLDLVTTSKLGDMTFAEKIEYFMDTVGKSEIGKEGLEELAEIDEYLRAVKVDPSYYRFDPSLARGLASYTGPIWEFEVIEGEVGSIAGCGRYDGLIGEYLGGEVPATGGSFGIERICDIIKDRGMLDLDKTSVDVIVTYFEDDLWKESLTVAESLRKRGIETMFYPDNDKLAKQFKFADRKNIPWVIVAGPDEIKEDKIQLKNMKTGDQELVTVDEAAEKIMDR